MTTMDQTLNAPAVLGGFPAPESVQATYDQADLDRAIGAYRFFFPTVSGAAMFAGNYAAGLAENRVFGTLDTQPKHRGFTLNSDTPYGAVMLDLRAGPMVLEVPPGPLFGAALDVHQGWVADLGIPGPDAGAGGEHLFLPPGYDGDVQPGFFAATSTTYRLLVGIRAVPVGGDVPGAMDLIRSVKVRPLLPVAGWTEPTWKDMSPDPQDTTPLTWETNLRYWWELHAVVDAEPPHEGYRTQYGDLAVLGIERGKPFAPDDRLRRILEEAARIGNAQMRVQSFADRRPDRVVWPDRQWQWAALRFENGAFDTPTHVDLAAREKWFFQAIAASPAMFRRAAGAGSLYWLGPRDATGAYLDGGKTYRLSVPQPVPAKLFWSVTVYDAQTRSQIQTDQGQAALRSLFELKDLGGGPQTELFFGPTAPAGREGAWIKTVPGRGWFVYFRIYGPEQPAFDGTWKPGDFETMA